MDPDIASEVAARLHEEFGPVASAVEEEIKASGEERKNVCGSGPGVQGWIFTVVFVKESGDAHCFRADSAIRDFI